MKRTSTDNNVRRFITESGFKILALARLSQCEYSTVLYILNCAVSGLDQFITTESELASLMGYEDEALRKTLADLSAKGIIRLHYGDNVGGNVSLRVGLQYDLSKWILAYEQKATSQDAVVFPFRRQGTAMNLQVLDGQKKDKQFKSIAEKNAEKDPTWQRVLESFVQSRSLDEDELEQAEYAARILVETHPVDQVLLMLRHFGQRIPTLSLLASSWQHYQEIYEEETQKVDLLGARQKHLELDQKIRDLASQLIEKQIDLELTEEEMTVLHILQKHRHPRRQLFWAYQLRSRYPHLTSFFLENVALMLPVTSGGTVIRRPSE